MADSERDARVKRFQWLCEREARNTNLPVDHPRVTVRAGMAFAYELQLNQMIETGRTSEQAAFVRLSEVQLAEIPDPPPPEHKLDIRIIGRDQMVMPTAT